MPIRTPTKAAPKQVDPQVIAREAVTKFEAELAALMSARVAFSKRFPEADAELNEIKRHEDEVRSLAELAKAKVASAGVSVGSFELTKAFSTAGLDKKELVEVLKNLPEAGELLLAMLQAGGIKEIATEAPVVNALMAQNPEYDSALKPAWKPSTELTPRVKTPKF